MGELSKFTDDNESAPGEDKKDSKETQARRWVNPPLVPRSLELTRDRAASREALPPPPPPTLLEQVLSKDLLEKSQTNEEDEEDEEKPASEERPREATGAAGEASSEVSEESAGNVPATETAPAEMPEQAAMEEEAVPDEGPDDTVLHVHHQPDVPAAEYVPAADTEEEEPVAASGGSGGFGGFGATPPPPPPPAVPPPAAAPNFGPTPNWNMAPANTSANTYNTAPASAVSTEQYRADIKETARDAEKRGLRKGLVAGFITGYVLKAYLANRKRERYEKATEKQLSERDEQISQLQREQQQLARQVTARAEEYRQRQESPASNRPAEFEAGAVRPKAEALPPQESRLEEPIFDQEGNEIVLQPGWRVERSAGGYSVVLDEHNRVVHDAIRYGEAFKREQKREQLSDDMFAAVGSGAAVGGHAGSQYVTAGYSPPQQASDRPSLPAPMPEHHEVDLKHRLPEPRSQLMATVTSPWLWTAIALLIIVYFIAALA